LLLQVASDENAGMIYFWIRRDDLEARDFGNVWTILQCY